MSNAKYRRVADEIVARIQSGELRPGDDLPSVRELTKEWGNSTAVAAIRWLRDNGWAETTPGAGTTVAESPPGPSLEDRVADLERRLAEAPTRAEFEELKAQVEQLYRDRAEDITTASSATPRRRRAAGQ